VCGRVKLWPRVLREEVVRTLRRGGRRWCRQWVLLDIWPNNRLSAVIVTLDVSRTVSKILTHKSRWALTRDRPHCPLTALFYTTRRNIRTNLIPPETRVHAGNLHRWQYVPILVFTQLFSELASCHPSKSVQKQNLTPNSPSGHSRSYILGSLERRQGTK